MIDGKSEELRSLGEDRYLVPVANQKEISESPVEPRVLRGSAVRNLIIVEPN